jgi:hypothetical protein
MQTNGDAVQPQAGAMVRQEFGARQMAVSGETSAAAVAAQAQAAVQARYVMALQRPRDMDDVRARLIRECGRPGFAEAARYHKPIGEGVEGPSIRFAEATIRLMGNILVESPTIYDDTRKRIIRVVVTDLETNATFQSDIVLEKTVERSRLRDGQEAVSERTNSRGRRVYLVEATEDDLLNKQNALISKAIRTNGLRLLPGDILEECMDKCVATIRAKDAADPEAARRKLADAFTALGVNPSDLKAYLGHELAQITPPEMLKLRGLYQAMRDGETSWSAIMETQAKATTTAAPPPPAAAQPAATPAPGEPGPVDKALAFIAEAATLDDLKKAMKRIVDLGVDKDNGVRAAYAARQQQLKGGAA